MTLRVVITGGGTGGHLMPALAIAEELRSAHGAEVSLVGAERGIEAQILPRRDFPYELLPVEPIYRRNWWRNIRLPWNAVHLLMSCRSLINKKRPGLVVGTGGYAAWPMLARAVVDGVPLALQEQNAFPGFTTRRMARWAAQVHLGFPEAASRSKAPRERVYTFGNPVAAPIPRSDSKSAAKRSVGVDPDLPTLFVVGGSQGALSINELIAGAIDAALLRGVGVVWSTGKGNWERFGQYHSPPSVVARAFWDPIGEAYEAADLVVGRAGAMSTTEFCSWSLPSILVPLPGAAADHQTANAVALEDAGAAVHLSEAGLTPDRLASVVQGILRSPSQLVEMGRAAKGRWSPDSVARICSQLVETMR